MTSGKPKFLAWEWLLIQTGNEYTGNDGLRNFRKKAIEQIRAILAVHSGLILTIQRGRRGQQSGIWVSNLSSPSVPPGPAREKPFRNTEARRAKPSTPSTAPNPAPQSTNLLKPTTLETFRRLYPGLDPEACQAAFDAWQAGLPPENKARRYDTTPSWASPPNGLKASGNRLKGMANESRTARRLPAFFM